MLSAKNAGIGEFGFSVLPKIGFPRHGCVCVFCAVLRVLRENHLGINLAPKFKFDARQYFFCPIGANFNIHTNRWAIFCCCCFGDREFCVDKSHALA